MYPNENYPFVLALHKKKLDSIHRWSLSCFKDKLWFQTKWRLQMLFMRNQRIYIVYPNENYPFFLAPCKNKLNSIQGRSDTVLRINFDFERNEGYKCVFSWNQYINIVYLNENYPFVLTHFQKKLDSILGRSLSRFKKKNWFQTKRRLQILFSWNQCINIKYPNETYPFSLAPREKKLDSIHGWSSSCFKDKH